MAIFTAGKGSGGGEGGLSMGDSDSEAEEVFDETACFMASTSYKVNKRGLRRNIQEYPGLARFSQVLAEYPVACFFNIPQLQQLSADPRRRSTRIVWGLKARKRSRAAWILLWASSAGAAAFTSFLVIDRQDLMDINNMTDTLEPEETGIGVLQLPWERSNRLQAV
ncbi:hypothetical protein Tco_0598009 [Tanacetum coccineum]